MHAQPPLHYYRLFPIDFTGHVMGVPDVIKAGDDDQAVQAARLLVSGRTVELWLGSRLVTTLNRKKSAEMPHTATAFVL